MPTIVDGVLEDEPVLDWRQFNKDFKEANKDAPPGTIIAISTTPPTAKRADGTTLMKSEATEEELEMYKQNTETRP